VVFLLPVPNNSRRPIRLPSLLALSPENLDFDYESSVNLPKPVKGERVRRPLAENDHGPHEGGP
jgi:hypothetical protein